LRKSQVGAGSDRILLLTGTAPTPDGVGGIILAELCTFLPEGSVYVACLSEGAPSTKSSVVESGLHMRTISVPYQRHPVSRFGALGKALGWIAQTVRNRRQLTKATAECVDWGRRHSVDRVWAIMDSPLSIEIAEAVAKQLGVPLYVTVWDDVQHIIRYFVIDRLTAKRLSTRFDVNLLGSSSCAVIGETMQAEYQAKYHLRTVILRHGLAPDGGSGQASRSTRDDLIIGFAGTLTARSAFEALLATLDESGWTLNGKRVRLRLIGRRFVIQSNVERRIECLGWLPSVEEAVRSLSECDVTYMPQPFEADWLPFARLSFPTKLTTYLAAGAPVLVHSPKAASLPAFLARYPFGVWCDSLETRDIKQALQKALDPELAKEFSRAGHDALQAEFSPEVFRSRFASFMGLDEEFMSP
jgi:glycosyltransferase involved in cell wall biosynthesis